MHIYKAKWILPSKEKVIENGAVLVENGKIVEILNESRLEDFNDIQITDFKNAVITPGFINLHTHLQFTDLMKDFRESGNNFIQWIIELINQYNKWDYSQKINSVRNGMEESILSGTTCIAQISKEDFSEIFTNSAIKTYLFLETFSNSEETSIVEFKRLKEKINSIQLNDSLIGLGLSPHSIYNVHPVLWGEIANFSRENNVLVQTHLAESKSEIDWLRQGYSDIDLLHKAVGWDKITPFKTGLGPVKYLEELGILNTLGKNLILAHLNQLDDESFKKLAGYDINIAHCPRSNVLLHNKTLNLLSVKELTDKIGIGTDSKASNYDLSLINEIKFIKNNTGLGSLKLLDMLTLNTAKILKIDDKIGSLEKGKEADFLTFNLDDNEFYEDFIKKEKPDYVYINGNQIVKDKKLVKTK